MIARRRLFQALAAAALLACAAARARAEAYYLVACGSGGEAEFSERFADWGARLRIVCENPLGAKPGNVWLLKEGAEKESPRERKTSREAIGAAIKEIAEKAGPGDSVVIVLIGHGSGMRNVPKFEIPGADLAASDLKEMLAPLKAGWVAVIDSTSCSAGFINELSAPNRVVCSATKSLDETNATNFMEHFIHGIEDGSADLDRDERISVLEACRQAASLTAAWYAGQGIIPTEHALIDDNGDGFGSRLAAGGEGDPLRDELSAQGKLDGEFAAACFLKDFTFPARAPRELVDRYLGLLDQIAKHKKTKTKADEKAYFRKLESLLIDAARANREIRKFADPAPAAEEFTE